MKNFDISYSTKNNYLEIIYILAAYIFREMYFFKIFEHVESEKWQYLADMEDRCSKFLICCVQSK